jgi:O-antigen/teichoic acid export membrane protein
MNAVKKVVARLLSSIGISLKGKGLSYLKDTSWVGIATSVEYGLSYILILLISRLLNAEGLGQYSFVLAFAGLFFIFSDWGMSPLMVKDLSRDFSQANKYISNIITFKGLLLISSLIVYLVTLMFLGRQDVFLALIIVGIISLAGRFSGFFKNILRIKHKAKPIALTLVLERFLAVIIGGFILWQYQSLNLFFIGLLASELIRLVVIYLFARKYFTYSFSFDWSFLKSLFVKGYPFIFIAVFAMVYVQLDTIMLSFMKGDVVTGWYNAAYKLINILNIITGVMLTFGAPLFSKLYKENKQQLRTLFEHLLKYSLLLLFPIVVGVQLLSSRIVEFVYSFNSPETALVFQILIIAQVFVFLTTISSSLVAYADKQHIFAKIAGLGAVINIVLNLLLIPKFSLYGAAIATLITYVLMFIITHLYIKKKIISFSLLKNISFAIMGSLALWFFIPMIIHLHLLFIIAISGLLYGGLFVAYELISHKLIKRTA